ncbi:YihY/virulence factor BrkB family protein [Leekyejoonella antrihumi]|uniref:YihY/virulence factor BrkB family protein n=2 Tax=Leekyejoonella antrihumi TaxID=1660198 RepID=A0A563DR10_9MICO|nr:YihY/virulence factor BrkB family protein [Leekyejoonella antrihumi]
MDRAQRRFPWLGYPLAVVYKFFDDMGSYLAATLTYYVFVSLFPILLLASTVLGIVLKGHPHLQAQLLDSALSQFPVIGDQLKVPHGLDGSWGVVTIGGLVALYGALGAAQAFQYAANTVWQVPRNERPNPFAARGRSVLLLVTVGVGLLLTTALTSLLATVVRLQGLSQVAVLVGATLVSIAVFVFAFHIGSALSLRSSSVLPGAVVAGILWQVLQHFGVIYVSHVVRHASAVNGVFAVVLGMLAFIYLASLIIVICMEIDVVRCKQLFPRALLTPFTDDVELTRGDVASYTGQAQATRSKGFQRIDVDFNKREDDPDDGDDED